MERYIIFVIRMIYTRRKQRAEKKRFMNTTEHKTKKYEPL